MIISEKESKLLIDNSTWPIRHRRRKILEEIAHSARKNVLIEIEDAYFDLNKFVLAKEIPISGSG